MVKGIIPTPPRISYGTRDIDIFPDDYLKAAMKALKEYRSERDSRQRKEAR